MSIQELVSQNDCLSKADSNILSLLSQDIFTICSKSPSERAQDEKKILLDLLDHIKTVKQTFKNSADYKTALLQCSDYIEAHTYSKGTPLVMHGDKCTEVFLILNGTVNVYEHKTPDDFEKQKEEIQDAIAKKNGSPIKKNPTYRSLASILLKGGSQNNTSTLNGSNLIKEQGPSKLVNKNQPTSIENIPEDESLDSVPSVEETTPLGFTPQRKLKIRSVVTFMRMKPKSTEDLQENKQDQVFKYLPREERLLLEDEQCRRKYLKDGACLLGFKESISSGQIVNENCLLKSYRSPVTMVAQSNVQCISLNRDTFRELMKEEIEEIDDKKEFFLNFFQQAKQAGVLQILEFITKKKYRMHEKIYTEGEKCKGVYFVKSGGDVKLHLSVSQRNKDPSETDEVIDVIQAELFLPYQHKGMRKRQVVAAIVGKGDFFGEEDITLGQSTRKYTAISCSNELIVYCIPQKFYSNISIICPDVLRIIKERAMQRNAWIEGKIKSSEALKGRLFGSFQGSLPLKTDFPPQKPRNSVKVSPKETFINSNQNKQKERKSVTKYLLLKNEDMQQATEGNVPSHLAVAREKRKPTEEKRLTEALKTWSSPDYKLKGNDKYNPNMRNSDDFQKMKLITEASPRLYVSKLFNQEKNVSKHSSPKTISLRNQAQNKNRKTMTGLNKDEDFSPAFQNLVSNKVLTNIDSPKRAQGVIHYPSESSLVYHAGPQFKVRSYLQPESPSSIGSPRSDFFGWKSISTFGDEISSRRNLTSHQQTRPHSQYKSWNNVQSQNTQTPSIRLDGNVSPLFSASENVSSGILTERFKKKIRLVQRVATAAGNSGRVNNIHMKSKESAGLHKFRSNKNIGANSETNLADSERLNRSDDIRIETEPCIPVTPKIMLKSGMHSLRGKLARYSFMNHKL